MLDIVGGLLVLFAGTMLGFYKAAQYANRTRQIVQTIHALNRLETEIVFGFTPLPEALSKIGKQLAPPMSRIFREAADRLEEHSGNTTTESWHMAVTDNWKATSMKLGELEVIRQLGLTLGISDREDQQKHLHLAVSQLQAEEQTAREEQKRYEKMWKSLGVLAGALVVILIV